MPESSSLKISIWSAYSPSAPLVMTTSGDSGTEATTSIRELRSLGSGLHQEIFSWRINEDPFGGVANNDDRLRLRGALLEALGVEADPAARGVAKLREFLDDANAVVSSGRVEWSGSQSSASDEDEHRINPLLALINQIDWLVSVFDEQPEISVTVR